MKVMKKILIIIFNKFNNQLKGNKSFYCFETSSSFKQHFIPKTVISFKLCYVNGFRNVCSNFTQKYLFNSIFWKLTLRL